MTYIPPMRLQYGDGPPKPLTVGIRYDVPEHKSGSIGAPLTAPVTMRSILESVAVFHSLTAAELIGPSRRAHITSARQEAMWLMRSVMREGAPRYSLPMIGDFLGFRDHTTVLHGVRRHQARLDAAEKARAA